jgi:PAS domain S-box-containing protein
VAIIHSGERHTSVANRPYQEPGRGGSETRPYWTKEGVLATPIRKLTWIDRAEGSKPMTLASESTPLFGLGLLVRAFESSLDAVEIDDVEGNVIYVNHAWSRLFQRDVQQAVGARWDDLLSQVANISELRQSWERCMVEGSSQAAFRRRHEGGETLFITYTRTLYRNSDGVPTAVITIYRPQPQR